MSEILSIVAGINRKLMTKTTSTSSTTPTTNSKVGSPFRL